MRSFTRTVIVRDSRGNDRAMSYDIDKYDSVQEAANSAGEEYILRVINNAIEQTERNNRRMQLVWDLKQEAAKGWQ